MNILILLLRFYINNLNLASIYKIKKNVKWLGYEPFKITYSSDYFDILYDYAVILIKKGLAYVCELSKEQNAVYREKGENSPFRDRSVEENLKKFHNMRCGLYEEGSMILRAKIDMKHPNPTLRDPPIYRIKYVSHPHVGDKWCIYPLYDFTHPCCDSIEGITYSLCTLEFENRRDLYYWFVDNIGIYKAYEWEFSRLNVSNFVTSKRHL
jgi:glutaminyl-tRNA synthetase